MAKAYFHKYEYLKKYLDSELYCREERQYAVFLYNIFLKKKMNALMEPPETEIIKYCLNSGDSDNLDIDNVYFEATLMRDYFEKERKEFNEKLLSFCLEWLHDGSKLKNDLINKMDKKNVRNVNFGQKKVKDFINEEYRQIDIFNKKISAEDRKKAKEKACLDIARMMMNATPDLLVVYTKNGTKYAKALECKYESDEGRYKDIAGIECKMQLFIQECIMHFCFGSSKNEKGKYIPLFPSKSKWKNEPKLWEDICLDVYKGILEQTTDDTDTVEVKNAGVEMVRFCRPIKGTKKRNIIQINENVCIEVCIEQGELHPIANNKNKWKYI